MKFEIRKDIFRYFTNKKLVTNPNLNDLVKYLIKSQGKKICHLDIILALACEMKSRNKIISD